MGIVYLYSMKRISDIEKQRILELHQNTPMKPYLFEQSFPNFNIDTPVTDNTRIDLGPNKLGLSRNYKVGIEEKIERIKTLKERGFSLNLDFDVIVSLVAAVLEGFPGLGQLASAGVNIIHAISHFIRGLLSSSEASEMNSYFQGLVQFCMAFVPLAGDFISLGINQYMKTMIARTDIELINFLKKTFPFLNIKRGFSLKKKGGMKYLFWAAIKQFGLDRVLDNVTFEKVKQTCIDLIKWLSNNFPNFIGISQIIKSLNSIKNIIDDLLLIMSGKPITDLN